MIRPIVNDVLLRTSLLQGFYSMRSERQLMEQIDEGIGRQSIAPGITPPSRRTTTASSRPTSPVNS